MTGKNVRSPTLWWRQKNDHDWNNLYLILFSASELVTEDGLSPTFIEYIEGTRWELVLFTLFFILVLFKTSFGDQAWSSLRFPNMATKSAWDPGATLLIPETYYLDRYTWTREGDFLSDIQTPRSDIWNTIRSVSSDVQTWDPGDSALVRQQDPYTTSDLLRSCRLFQMLYQTLVRVFHLPIQF